MSDTERKVIFLVEDNPNDEALTIRALRQGNLSNEIRVARDGAEAADRLLGGPDRPPTDLADVALVLLDLKLPKIDGHELLQRLRSDPRTRRLPVVVLTSSREEQDLVRAYDAGCNSFVQKPVGFAEFSEAIRHLGLYWLMVNVGPPPARS